VWPKWYVARSTQVVFSRHADDTLKVEGQSLPAGTELHWSIADDHRVSSCEWVEITESEALARVTPPEDTSRPKNIHGTANDADESAEDPGEVFPDWVTQDRVPARNGIDEVRWSDWKSDAWIPANRNSKPNMHGERISGVTATLFIRCRRKDLPAKQPATNRVPMRLWVRNDACSHDQGAIVIAKPESPDDEMIELMHDADGFYVETEVAT
jgi:hypothetical protein